MVCDVGPKANTLKGVLMLLNEGFTPEYPESSSRLWGLKCAKMASTYLLSNTGYSNYERV